MTAMMGGLVFAGGAAAKNLQVVVAGLDKQAQAAANHQGSSKAKFRCPITTAQAEAAMPHGSGLKLYLQSDAEPNLCVYITGNYDTDYLNGSSVRLDFTREQGTVDNYYLSSTKILAHGCQLQTGTDTYGATLFEHCPPVKAADTVQDIEKFSFNSADRKDTWIVTVQYGIHVAHTEQDLLTGLTGALKAMS
jgi:hypothetical protein